MKDLLLSLVLLSILVFVISLLLQSEISSLMASGALHVALFSSASFFLWKGDLKQTLEGIGFPGDFKRSIMLSVAGMGAIFVILLALGIAAMVFGFNDQQAIYDKVADLPLFLLVFAVLAAPVSEELFFRALLVPRLGVLPSSAIFGLVHFSYGSIVEMMGAFLIGLILAAIFRSSKSITPCLMVHVGYNLLAIIVMRFLT